MNTRTAIVTVSAAAVAAAALFISLLGASEGDGVSWYLQIVEDTETLNGAVWGSGLYVAVGDSGDIVTSPDGVTWTSRPSTSSQDLFDVAWNGVRFVAVGDDVILSSEDGVTWTFRTQTNSGRVGSVAWGNGQFIAVGESAGGTEGLLMTSADGILWDTSDASYPVLSAIDWADGSFYLSHPDGLSMGTDGETWEPVIDRPGSNFHGVAQSPGMFVAVGDLVACVSDDGTEWTCTANTRGNLSNVVRGRDRFFAANSDVYSSIDGTTWTQSFDGAMYGLATSGLEVVAVGLAGGVAIGDIEEIFADGFERGDAGAWSSQVPTPTNTPTVTPTATATATPTATATVTETPNPTPTPDVVVDCDLVTVTNLQASGYDKFAATITNGLSIFDYGPPYLEITRTVWTWHPNSGSHYVDYFSVNSSSASYAYWNGFDYASPVDVVSQNWAPPDLYISNGSSAQWFVDLSPLLPRPAGIYQVCLDFDILNTNAAVTECLNVCASLEYAGDPTPTPTPTP